MEYSDLGSILPVLLSIGGPAIGAVYTFFATRSARADKALADIGKRLDEVEKRVQTLESEMAHLPNKDLITELRLALAKLEGTVGALNERVGGVAHTVGLIDESLRREVTR
jgi:uncharacterized coiled-coil protein SlyX